MTAPIWQGRLSGLRLIMVLAVLVLCLAGLACIHVTDTGNYTTKQMIWLGLGLFFFILTNVVPYRSFGQISPILFIISLFLLLFVLAGKYTVQYLHWDLLIRLVPSIRGSFRWIILGPISIQPSEIAKLTYIITLSWYLQNHRKIRKPLSLLGPLLLSALPMGLIVLEPDLGTTLLFPPILFAILFATGARVRHLSVIIIIAASLSPLLYMKMKGYQRERIQVLLKQGSKNPYWLRGKGYQLHQSKICIGSGQLTGQGRGKGIFVNYDRFLPDRHNDFIFALIAHQWGFCGGVAILVLYSILIIGGIEIAAHQPDPFGRLLALGIASLFAAQTFINIGMTMGLMPITGMTLPFISYGGSSLLSNFIALGLLANVARHRPHRLARSSFEYDNI